MTGLDTAAAWGTAPGRPVQPHRDAAYWARVRRIVDQAPPLTDDQRARIRTAFHQPHPERRAAA